jgi:serine/threonine protein phosphatase PrpC
MGAIEVLDTLADCAVATHGGPVRVHNEDHCLALASDGSDGRPRRYLLAVADGLGGRNAGEVASRTAVDSLAAAFHGQHAVPPKRWLARAFQGANLAVFDLAHSDPRYRSMQTTLTALLIEGDRVAIGHVGDCRVYRFRGGSVQQLTQDHTRLLDLIRVRLVSAEQALTHPARHMLTRSLGAEPIVSIDVTVSAVEAGDTYVVCSDGIWSALSRNNLHRLVSDLPAPEACERLMALGVTLDVADNISVGVAHVQRVVPGLAPPSLWKRLARRRHRGQST